MLRNNALIGIFLYSLILSACNTPAPLVPDEEAYMKEMQQWSAERLAKLKSEKGWLNLAGLFWLKEGENSFGSDPSNDIVFPEKAKNFCGMLHLENGKVNLKVKEDVLISTADSPVSSMVLLSDHDKNTTHLAQGELRWYIIKRGEKYGIRLRDLKHPRMEELDHIPSYPVNTDYVVEATLQAFDSAKTITVQTPVEGFTESYKCPGELHFNLGNKALTLHPFSAGKGYFLVLADETSGLDTYGAGRFMYAEPDSMGRIILDFNRATNPPCAFSPFATCPMPPRENFLPIALEAGEKSVHLH